MSTADEKLADSIRLMTAGYTQTQDRLDDIETMLARQALGRPPSDEGADTREAKVTRKMFNTFLRQGPEALEPAERKALVTGDDTRGGYLAPAEFVREILRNVVQFSPVRQAARIGQTAAGEVLIPKRTGRMTGRFVGETETRTQTEPTYGQLRIPMNQAAFYVDISTEMLEDAAFDVGSELAFDAAEEIGRLEGEKFLNGTGNKEPAGLMMDADVLTKNSLAATDITADGLIDTLYALAPFYRSKSTWMMNGTTLGKIRKLKDAYGQYLWSPSIAAGQPELILGRPVVEAIDMPDCAASATPIVVGDFSNYRIYDRLEGGLSVLRDPYSLATTGQTRFHFWKRVGGGVAKAEAFRKIVCSATAN